MDRRGQWILEHRHQLEHQHDPPAGRHVIISKSGNIQVTLTGSASVNSISVTGDTLTVSAGTLHGRGHSVDQLNRHALGLSNATLTLASGATLTNSGAITVNPLSSLNVGGAYTETSTGSLTLPSGSSTTGVGHEFARRPGFESPSAGSSTTTDAQHLGKLGAVIHQHPIRPHRTQSVQEPGNSGSGVNQSFSATPGVTYTASVYAMTPSTSKLTGPGGRNTESAFLQLRAGPRSAPTESPSSLPIAPPAAQSPAASAARAGIIYTTSGVAPAPQPASPSRFRSVPTRAFGHKRRISPLG